jgi:hypothetical protein
VPLPEQYPGWCAASLRPLRRTEGHYSEDWHLRSSSPGQWLCLWAELGCPTASPRGPSPAWEPGLQRAPSPCPLLLQWFIHSFTGLLPPPISALLPVTLVSS